MSTQPTDAEILELASQYWYSLDETESETEIELVRAALAKWGTPAPVEAEPLIPFRHGCKWCGKTTGCKHTQQPAPAGAAPECLTCSDHGAVGNILTAEPCPDCTRLNAQPAPATQQPGDVVAYLDVGAGGYLDLGSELSEDALQQLPKGRHALVIAGTYGIDGYVAAPQPSHTAQAAPAACAVAGPDDIDAIALTRYKVVHSHDSMFHRFAVVAGDGKQQLYLGRETECQNMTRKFAGAFLDGAFYQSQIAAPAPSAQVADSVQEDAARYRWLREGNDAKHGAAWYVAVNLYGCEWDAAIDAAMNKGGAT